VEASWCESEGAVVKAGQPLARLDDTLLRSKIAQARAAVDLNQAVGGYDNDGNPRAARTEADLDALRRTYEGGLKNSFAGPGLANIPILTQRGNADLVADIHDTMQDLIIRARLQRANGRSDNQVIWTSGSTVPFDYPAASLEVMNEWLDRIAADPGAASADKVVRNKPALAADACWDKSGTRIVETASADPAAACNLIYKRFSTPRLQAGSPLANDVLKCQLRPVAPSDYSVTMTSAEQTRLNAIFLDRRVRLEQAGRQPGAAAGHVSEVAAAIGSGPRTARSPAASRFASPRAASRHLNERSSNATMCWSTPRRCSPKTLKSPGRRWC
jgi:multidrug efflux pump subunit AcrA (membrane-fusion protein)